MNATTTYIPVDVLQEYLETDQKIQIIENQIQEETLSIRAKYKDTLDALTFSHSGLRFQLEAFATDRKDSGCKVFKTSFGEFGFRTGQPHLVELPGFDEKQALETLLERRPALSFLWWWAIRLFKKIVASAHQNGRFVRFKRELNRQALIDKYKHDRKAPILKAINVDIEQGEKFFIHSKTKK